MGFFSRLMVAVFFLPAAAGAQLVDLSQARLVDLTYSFSKETLYWPTSPSSFELEILAHGETEGGYFYSANSFCSPEHGGTHLDAPIHFSGEGQSTEAIPLTRLFAPGVVLDISDRARENPDAELTRQEVLDWEAVHGKIEEGSTVLLRTGWSLG